MKTPSAIHHKLLEYIDGTLTSAEVQALEQQLKTDLALRARLNELRASHAALRAILPQEQPSRDFTLKVMENLHHAPSQDAAQPIRKSILLLAGALIAAIGTAILMASGLFDSVTTTLDLNAMKPADLVMDTVPTLKINARMLVNAVIIGNIIIAFIVLDRTVLKPFFQKRLSS